MQRAAEGLAAAVADLVGTPIEVREFDDAFVAMPTDRALLGSLIWRALRAGVQAGIGRSSEEALLLLAHAAGIDAGGARQPAAPRAADAWLRQALQEPRQGAGGDVLVSEVVRAARAGGIAPTALRRASVRLGVIRTKAGMRSGWAWSLPPDGERVPGAGSGAGSGAGEGEQVEIEERAGEPGGEC